MAEAPISVPPAAEDIQIRSKANNIEECVEKAKRAFALKKYEQAVDHYATALEIMTETHGDGAPEAADLYLSYGKALLENAISQTAVLGREQAEEALAKDEVEESGSTVNKSGPFISFSGDAEEDDALAQDGEDVAVDLFAEATAAVDEEDKEGEGDEEEEEEGEGEPEDDFNAAWEVLDLARALYEKHKDEDDEVKLKLADTYIALGDVSLETEKFDQAITDYTAGASLKTDLLPLSSRQVAEAHYKLSMVLDLTSGRLAQAIEHAEKALDSVEARLAELRNGLSGQLPPVEEAVKPDPKGKGKATGPKLARDELVQNMSKSQIEGEIKELEELKEDLALKVEELKTSPNDELMNAPELAARALDKELNAPSSSSVDPSKSVVVNDLTTIVKKKKKPVDTTPSEAKINGTAETNGKRKAEDDAANETKKARVEDATKS